MALLLKNGNPLKKLIYHAREILFDNSDTSLEATDVQSALVEVDEKAIIQSGILDFGTVGANSQLVKRITFASAMSNAPLGIATVTKNRCTIEVVSTTSYVEFTVRNVTSTSVDSVSAHYIIVNQIN